MKTVIILAMHGSPPRDFPRPEMAEFMRLHGQAEAAGRRQHSENDRYALLEKKMRQWPRTAHNDPFYTASQELAARLSEVTGYQVIVGFNEFCAPTLDQAMQTAADSQAEKIIVATPMMTRGGQHTEKDIPAKVNAFNLMYPQIKFVYAWPFDSAYIARFLADHIAAFE